MKITSLKEIDSELHNFLQDFVFSISLVTEAKSCILHITNNVIDAHYIFGKNDINIQNALCISSKQRKHINCVLYLDQPQNISSKLHIHVKSELELVRKFIEIKLQLFFRKKWQNRCYLLETRSKAKKSIDEIFKSSLEFINEFIDIDLQAIYYSDKKGVISCASHNDDKELLEYLIANIHKSLKHRNLTTLYERTANYYIYARQSGNYFLCLFFKEEIHPIYLLAISFFVNELLWLTTSIKWHEREKDVLKSLIKSFVASLEAKDVYTRGHSEGVAYYTQHIGKALGVSKSALKVLHQVALVHDIGKVGIPDHVLLKPAKLTKKEFEIIKLHPVIGEELIARIKDLSGLAPMVRHHHERWDGRGYPDRLRGEDIPFFSRIIAVADAFDAMINKRVYREGKKKEAALKELAQNAGTQFDPHMIEKAINILEKIDIYSPQEDSFIPEHVEIARKEFFYRDMLTGCKNATALSLDTQDMNINAQFIFFDIRNFQQLNLTLGFVQADKILINFYNLLSQFFEEDNIYRIGADEFVVVLLTIKKIGEITKIVKNIEKKLGVKINFNIFFEEFSTENVDSLINKFKLKKYHLSQLNSSFKLFSRLYNSVAIFDNDLKIIRKKKISPPMLARIKQEKDKLHRITQYGQMIGYVYYEDPYAKT
ncbi:HD domain-containing phosphohydrolase [Desulfovulcanus sp.]